MKKAILTFMLVFMIKPARCDVIFFPYQYTGIAYSAELIYGIEKVKKPKKPELSGVVQDV